MDFFKPSTRNNSTVQSVQVLLKYPTHLNSPRVLFQGLEIILPSTPPPLCLQELSNGWLLSRPDPIMVLWDLRMKSVATGTSNKAKETLTFYSMTSICPLSFLVVGVHFRPLLIPWASDSVHSKSHISSFSLSQSRNSGEQQVASFVQDDEGTQRICPGVHLQLFY